MLQGSPLSGAEVPVTTICVCTCTAVLTYSALSDPHSHCKQCFPRLDGPRGKHPWQGLSSQTGLALTSRLRAGIGQLLPGRGPTHNWQSSKGSLHNVTSTCRIILFPVWLNTRQLYSHCTEVGCICTLLAFYRMAKQHISKVSATVHCTEVACIFALLAFYHMAQGSHKKN